MKIFTEQVPEHYVGYPTVTIRHRPSDYSEVDNIKQMLIDGNEYRIELKKQERLIRHLHKVMNLLRERDVQHILALQQANKGIRRLHRKLDAKRSDRKWVTTQKKYEHR